MPEDTPPGRQKLSQVPSWIMLGFICGVIVMWGFRSDPEPASKAEPELANTSSTVAATSSEPAGVNVAALTTDPSLSAVEALFDQYRDFAFWDEGLTEIAVWNTATNAFSDHFEITRTETGTYFRTIAGF